MLQTATPLSPDLTHKERLTAIREAYTEDRSQMTISRSRNSSRILSKSTLSYVKLHIQLQTSEGVPAPFLCVKPMCHSW